jgi:AraC family transcriptional regulator
MNLNKPPELVGIGISSERRSGVYDYQMQELWSFHLYEYSVQIELVGHGWLNVHPGYVTIVPANVIQRYHYESPSNHIYTHYRLSLNEAPNAWLPAVYDMGSNFPALKRRAIDAMQCFENRPSRSEAFLWDSLWMMAERGPIGATEQIERNHPAFIAARNYIDTNLALSITIKEIIAVSGISQSHLLRLFRAAAGDSIIGYLRRRRAQTARHLLINTTLPIKAVAYDVGIRDLQQFNKFIHKFWGRSPRSIRSQL